MFFSPPWCFFPFQTSLAVEEITHSPQDLSSLPYLFLDILPPQVLLPEDTPRYLFPKKASPIYTSSLPPRSPPLVPPASPCRPSKKLLELLAFPAAPRTGQRKDPACRHPWRAGC